MISYKRDVLERQSLSEVKMVRGFPVCERVCKNNVPRHQIAKALPISSSTVHNIIKRFRETGEISVCKEQGQRLLLDALRWHCITHWHDSVIDIAKWAQEYFQEPLSVNTICRAICICQLKLYHAKRKSCVKMVQKHRFVLWSRVEKVFYGQTSPNLTFMLSAFSSKAIISDGMGVHKCILGMCISMTEADAIHISMHSQWYDTLKIHMKQLVMLSMLDTFDPWSTLKAA